MLPETYMSKTQKDTLAKLDGDELKAEIRCCWYLGNTLTSREKTVLATMMTMMPPSPSWTRKPKIH